jgi:hypothetical protein
MLRSFAFALALAAAAVLGLAFSLFGAGMALAGTITGTSATFSTDRPTALNLYEDWAVWNADSLQANVTNGAGWLNYSLTSSSPATPLSNSPAAAIFYTGSGYYAGGLSYVSSNLDGKGFSLTVPEQYANDSTLDLWILANGPVSVFVEAVSGGDSSTPVVLAPYNQYRVSFTSSGLDAPLTVHMSNAGEYSSAQGGMSLGAAALSPVVVPEPEYWMALALLIGGFLAYRAVEVIWWFYDTVRTLEDDFEGRQLPEGDLEDRWLP